MKISSRYFFASFLALFSTFWFLGYSTTLFPSGSPVSTSVLSLRPPSPIPPSTQDSLKVTRLLLVDADQDAILQEISHGDRIKLPKDRLFRFNIIAEISPQQVGSVSFSLNGAMVHQQTENIYPYTLFGEASSQDFKGKTAVGGTYNLEVLAFAGAHLSGLSGSVFQVQFEFIESNEPTSLYRINVGGNDITDLDSGNWENDKKGKYFTGGWTASKPYEIANTESDIIYQTYRYVAQGSRSFAYHLPVRSNFSAYTVKLHFMEPYFGSPQGIEGRAGQRIFHVDIEGERVLDSLDIFQEVGATHALVKTFENIQLDQNNTLDIQFTSVVNNAIVSAIEVYEEGVPTRPWVIEIHGSSGNLLIDHMQEVALDENFSTELFLLNSALDRSTVNNLNITLTNLSNHQIVDAQVNSTGGGDAITLVPCAPLESYTTYRLDFKSDITDLDKNAIVPYSLVFRTGAHFLSQSLQDIRFEKVALPQAAGKQYTSLCIGPDSKLYALTIDGLIKRFRIDKDGLLGEAETISSLRKHKRAPDFGTGPKMAVGLVFDPKATADNLIAWVSYSGHYTFEEGPEWDGNIARLSGKHLDSVEDMVIHLPRSLKDHLTSSMAFGPDQQLYISQGGNTAMGRADAAWGNRSEKLLSAAILRLDLQKLEASKDLPLDVKTAEGGSYDPSVEEAPLTLYATGIRNAYDLVWHSNGELYVPTNGSALGGNTPGFYPEDTLVENLINHLVSDTTLKIIPAVAKVTPTQSDWLYRIKAGRYYGHPNPRRGEYILNRGDLDVDNPAYDGIAADPNFDHDGLAFNFENNKSPNGAIEYQSKAFGGKLKGKLLVVRYSQNDDIIILEPDNRTHNIVKSFVDVTGEAGMRCFQDPLDLVEDPLTGNLYVSEFGGAKLTLLRVTEPLAPSRLVLENLDGFPAHDQLSFSRIQEPWFGSPSELGPNANHDEVTLRLHNQYPDMLHIDSLIITNPDYWQITNLDNISLSIPAGQALDIRLKFIARNPAGARDGLVKVLHEALKIYNSHEKQPKTVLLHGLWQKQGEGDREPHLQEIVDAFGLSTNIGFTDKKAGDDFTLAGDEIRTRFFTVADPKQAVRIMQLAAYHSCCDQFESIRYSIAGGPVKPLFAHLGRDAQSLLPRPQHLSNQAQAHRAATGYFRPDGFVDLVVNGNHTDFYKNYPHADQDTLAGRLALRVWPLKDHEGKIVEHHYLVAQDYVGPRANYDYNDNVYLISNVLPYEPVSSTNLAARAHFEEADENVAKPILDAETEVQVYPNPFSHRLQVKSQLSQSNSEIVEVKLLSLDGQYQRAMQTSAAHLEAWLNEQLRPLNPGVYILQIHSKGRTYTTKLIKNQ